MSFKSHIQEIAPKTFLLASSLDRIVPAKPYFFTEKVRNQVSDGDLPGMGDLDYLYDRMLRWIRRWISICNEKAIIDGPAELVRESETTFFESWDQWMRENPHERWLGSNFHTDVPISLKFIPPSQVATLSVEFLETILSLAQGAMLLRNPGLKSDREMPVLPGKISTICLREGPFIQAFFYQSSGIVWAIAPEKMISPERIQYRHALYAVGRVKNSIEAMISSFCALFSQEAYSPHPLSHIQEVRDSLTVEQDFEWYSTFASLPTKLNQLEAYQLSQSLSRQSTELPWIPIDTLPHSCDDVALNTLIDATNSPTSCAGMIDLIQSLPNFNMTLSPQEKNIISTPGSVMLIGRSGTGKTSCALFRFWSSNEVFRRLILAALPAPDSSESTAPSSALNISYNSIFLTLSPILCTSIMRYYASMEQKTESHLSHLFGSNVPTSSSSSPSASSGKNGEDRATATAAAAQSLRDSGFLEKDQFDLEIEDTSLFDQQNLAPSFLPAHSPKFPMFLTLHRFLYMLDGTLPAPFFTRQASGEIITGSNAAISWHGEMKTTIRVNHYPHSTTWRKSHVPVGTQSFESFEIDFEYFDRYIFPKLGITAQHSSHVWTVFMNYDEPSTKSKSHDRDQSIFHIAFNRYKDIKSKLSAFDIKDLISYLHRSISSGGYHGVPLHSLTVDEVQDFSPSTLRLMMLSCSRDNGFFFCGDSCQTIARGISFRFSDLRQMIFTRQTNYLNRSLFPEVKQLTVNYRSHTSLLHFGHSIVLLMEKYFPSTIDKLQLDRGVRDGPKPILFQVNSPQELFFLIRGKGEMGELQFGANQAIIVRNQEAKETLPDILKHSLVLTVFECKGLEFDDVLLWNFFSDSIASEVDWLVMNNETTSITEADQSNSEDGVTTLTFEQMNLHEIERLNSKTERSSKITDAHSLYRAVDFNEQKHTILCSELKQLYTAITRPKNKLWIYDSDLIKRTPMYRYWVSSNLVDLASAELIGSGIAAQTSPEEWGKQGRNMLRYKFYHQAITCFTFSKEPRYLTYAEACLAAVNASKSEEPQRTKQYLSAAHQFDSIACFRKAAQCFYAAKDFASAADRFLSASDFLFAAQSYRDLGRLELAARYFFQAEAFPKLLECLAELDEHQQCLLLLLNHAESMDTVELDIPAAFALHLRTYWTNAQAKKQPAAKISLFSLSPDYEEDPSKFIRYLSSRLVAAHCDPDKFDPASLSADQLTTLQQHGLLEYVLIDTRNSNTYQVTCRAAFQILAQLISGVTDRPQSQNPVDARFNSTFECLQPSDRLAVLMIFGLWKRSLLEIEAQSAHFTPHTRLYASSLFGGAKNLSFQPFSPSSSAAIFFFQSFPAKPQESSLKLFARLPLMFHAKFSPALQHLVLPPCCQRLLEITRVPLPSKQAMIGQRAQTSFPPLTQALMLDVDDCYRLLSTDPQLEPFFALRFSALLFLCQEALLPEFPLHVRNLVHMVNQYFTLLVNLQSSLRSWVNVPKLLDLFALCGISSPDTMLAPGSVITPSVLTRLTIDPASPAFHLASLLQMQSNSSYGIKVINRLHFISFKSAVQLVIYLLLESASHAIKLASTTSPPDVRLAFNVALCRLFTHPVLDLYMNFKISPATMALPPTYALDFPPQPVTSTSFYFPQASSLLRIWVDQFQSSPYYASRTKRLLTKSPFFPDRELIPPILREEYLEDAQRMIASLKHRHLADNASNWYEIFLRLSFSGHLECFPELLQASHSQVGRHALMLVEMYQQANHGDLLEAARTGLAYLSHPASAGLSAWQISTVFEQAIVFCMLIYPYSELKQPLTIPRRLFSVYAYRFEDYSTKVAIHLKKKSFILLQDPDPIWYTSCELVEWAFSYLSSIFHRGLKQHHFEVTKNEWVPMLLSISLLEKNSSLISDSEHLRHLWQDTLQILPKDLRNPCAKGLQHPNVLRFLSSSLTGYNDLVKVVPFGGVILPRGSFRFAPPSTPERQQHKARATICRAQLAEAETRQKQTRWSAAHRIAVWWRKIQRSPYRSVLATTTGFHRIQLQLLSSSVQGAIQPRVTVRDPMLRAKLVDLTQDTQQLMLSLYRCSQLYNKIKTSLIARPEASMGGAFCWCLDTLLLLGRMINGTLAHHTLSFHAFVQSHPQIEARIVHADIASLCMTEFSSDASMASSSTSTSVLPPIDVPAFVDNTNSLLYNLATFYEGFFPEITVDLTPKQSWSQQLKELKKKEKNAERLEMLADRRAMLKKLRRAR